LSAYQPGDGSPAIDAGIDLAADLGISTGSRDFFGSPVPQHGGYDVGAVEIKRADAADSPPVSLADRVPPVLLGRAAMSASRFESR